MANASRGTPLHILALLVTISSCKSDRPRDTEPPRFDGKIEAVLHDDELELSWAAAHDDTTPQDKLAYTVCADATAISAAALDASCRGHTSRFEAIEATMTGSTSARLGTRRNDDAMYVSVTARDVTGNATTRHVLARRANPTVGKPIGLVAGEPDHAWILGKAGVIGHVDVTTSEVRPWLVTEGLLAGGVWWQGALVVASRDGEVIRIDGFGRSTPLPRVGSVAGVTVGVIVVAGTSLFVHAETEKEWSTRELRGDRWHEVVGCPGVAYEAYSPGLLVCRSSMGMTSSGEITSSPTQIVRWDGKGAWSKLVELQFPDTIGTRANGDAVLIGRGYRWRIGKQLENLPDAPIWELLLDRPLPKPPHVEKEYNASVHAVAAGERLVITKGATTVVWDGARWHTRDPLALETYARSHCGDPKDNAGTVRDGEPLTIRPSASGSFRESTELVYADGVAPPLPQALARSLSNNQWLELSQTSTVTYWGDGALCEYTIGKAPRVIVRVPSVGQDYHLDTSPKVVWSADKTRFAAMMLLRSSDNNIAQLVVGHPATAHVVRLTLAGSYDRDAVLPPPTWRDDATVEYVGADGVPSTMKL